jgi:hypothetical protein
VQGRGAVTLLGVSTVRPASSNNTVLPHPPSSRRETHPPPSRRFYWRAVGRCGSTGPAVGRLSSVACVHCALFSFRPSHFTSHFIISAVGHTCGFGLASKPLLFLRARCWLCIRIFLLGMFLHSHILFYWCLFINFQLVMHDAAIVT